MRFRIPLITVLLLATHPGLVQHASSQEREKGTAPANTAIRTRIDEYLTNSTVNGLSGAVLVARNGKVIFNGGYGIAEKKHKTPNTADTLFVIGSVTKQFTAAAILKLVEQGKLETTDVLSDFFDDLPDDKKSITIHQLLTHTAGLIDSFGEGDFDHIPEQRFFEILFSSKLLHKPGYKHEYSNAGYSVLAKIIENVSKQEYEQFLREQLFQPAGMEQTGYLLPDWSEDRLAHGYRYNVVASGTMLQRYRDDQKISWNLKGNGGLISTQGDMFKWYQAIKSQQVLPESLIKQWMTPYVAEQEAASSHYAYGWAIYKSKRNSKIVSHNGGNGVFFHDFIFLPEEDVVIIFSSNAASQKIESVAWQIEKIIFDENYRPNPISRNPYFLVFDFVQNHEATQSEELLKLIKGDHQADFEESHVLNRLGYHMLREGKNLAWAVALFDLNTQLFPDNGNVRDSLGDGYLAIEKKDQAIAAFRKAIELGSGETAEKLQRLLENK